MRLGFIIGQAIGATLAGAVVGLFLCWSLWQLFKLIHHPEWGPALVAIPFAFALAGRLPDSEFLRRVLVFAASFAGPFWVAGRVWRVNLKDRQLSSSVD